MTAAKDGNDATGAAGMRLEVLSQGDLDAIHSETLKVLEETGVFVEDD